MARPQAFDYVIVGAGSAGCVIANRLSADQAARVLLLEAGGWDWHPLVRVPLGVGRIWGFDRFDWGYSADSGSGTGNRRIETARGKLIGGSHSINAMGYIRGNHADFDAWSRQGLDGWSFREILPYFKRSETWEDGENQYRGGNGRFMFAEPRISIRFMTPILPPALPLGTPTPMITTARSSTASAGRNGLLAPDGATARRAPIFIRCWDAVI
jgi:choline dehydrogenase-like flavoprotein